MAQSTSPEREFYNEAKTVSPPFWIAIGFGFGILFMVLLNNVEIGLIDEFLSGLKPENLAPEVVGIVFTIGVIDQLNRQRDKRNLKAQLIRHLRSLVNNVAISAAEELREQGWLRDGTLKGVNLTYANLERVNLNRGHLEGADLRHAHLKGAYLGRVIFEDANLYGTHLEGASLRLASLVGAKYIESAFFDEQTILPDSQGDPYNMHDLAHKRWNPDTDMTRYTNPDHPNFWKSGMPIVNDETM